MLGYCLADAEDMEEAESLAVKISIIESVRIYEPASAPSGLSLSTNSSRSRPLPPSGNLRGPIRNACVRSFANIW
jgi:hypothetical protein